VPSRTNGRWYLRIGNLEWISDELTKLARELVEFVQSEVIA